jgi:small-conductance mechanosensitive channel
MKKILTALCIFLITQILAYTFAAYVMWEPYPGNWQGGERAFTAIMGLLIGVGAVGGYITFQEDKYK